MSYARPAGQVVDRNELRVVGLPRRPATVTWAAVLLAGMALAGLGYAVLTLLVTPGVVGRLRAAAAAEPAIEQHTADGYVTVLWAGAGLAAALGVIVFALYAALALGLHWGSPAARVVTWVVCALGTLGGGGSAAVVVAQRSGWVGGVGPAGPEALPVLSAAAYPGGWIELNVALSVAQLLGYLAVAALLWASPTAYFRR